MKLSLPLAVFLINALLNLTGAVIGNEMLMTCTKPLLMPLLAWWFLTETVRSTERSFLRRAVLGALAFSTLGDVLLMFSGPLFFLGGLFLFLLAHVFYLGAFSSVAGFKHGFLRYQPWWALPFLAFPGLLLYLLWTGIPAGMRLPVALYAGIITTMALSVANLKGRVSDVVFWTMLAGAALFLLSDSLIAVARFGQNFPGARVAIILTYVIGQFLLVRGVVKILGKQASGG